MKEQYELEIRQLRGQHGAPSAPAAAPSQSVGGRASPVVGAPSGAPRSSAQMPPYQGTLPSVFASSGLASQPPTHHTMPPPANSAAKFGSRMAAPPPPPAQLPSRIPGIPSLPTTTPGAPNPHNVGNTNAGLPALTGGVPGVPRSAPAKMHISMMQPGLGSGVADVSAIGGHGMKKEPTRAVGGSVALGNSLGNSLGGPPGNPGSGFVRQSVVATQAPGLSQSQQEEDYVVYQGRAANNSLVNVKVGLQSSFTHDSVVCCVRYSWDGDYLATGSNKSAQIFDAATGRTVARFAKDGGGDVDERRAADSYVRAVCFSPDGQWLITGAEDHVVKVWDVRHRTVKHKLIGHDTDIYSVDASANGHFIISGSGDKKAKLWSLETGKLLSTLGEEFGPTDGITSVSVSPTSQHVAAGSLDKIVRVWDVESGRLVRQFGGHNDSVYSVAFSPDGRMLLSGSLDKSLKLWDLAAAQPSSQCRLSFDGHKDFVLSVAFSPNGRWLISGSKDRTVQFWDPRQSTMAVQLQGHKNSVISIAHNPRSKSLATGSGDCRARTWTYT